VLWPATCVVLPEEGAAALRAGAAETVLA
jgi:hypothetical protein